MRVEELDWARVAADLDAEGWARLDRLLTQAECAAVAARYADSTQFRSKVLMARHGFGRGEYQYFAYPLPEPIATLRSSLYPRLAPIANHWYQRMGVERRFPPTQEAFLAECHASGQARPTPLLLRYGPEDYNCLHQDLYGDQVFPLQVAVLLSDPERDYTGGELVLTEQRPRRQSRAMVVPLRRGDGVVFAVRDRPVEGVRGTYRVQLRHGVSKLRSGERFTLGLIFHDAA